MEELRLVGKDEGTILDPKTMGEALKQKALKELIKIHRA